MQDFNSIKEELINLEYHLHEATRALAETGDVESGILDEINELVTEALELLWQIKVD